MRILVGEGIVAFIVVERWHLLVGLEVFSFLESIRGVFYGILSLWESLWILRSVESKLFPYTRDTWVASNHWSVPLARNAPSVLTPSAPWGRQSHEGVSLRVPYEASCRFLFFDEYYGNWRTRNMSSTRIVVVNPCRRCKTSVYSWLQHLLIFSSTSIYIYIYIYIVKK